MANDGLIRVLLVDDNTVMIYAIRTILEQYPNIEVVGEAINGEEAIKRAEELQPNVVVMDINMPKMNGIVATRLIQGKSSRHSRPRTYNEHGTMLFRGNVRSRRSQHLV